MTSSTTCLSAHTRLHWRTTHFNVVLLVSRHPFCVKSDKNRFSTSWRLALKFSISVIRPVGSHISAARHPLARGIGHLEDCCRVQKHNRDKKDCSWKLQRDGVTVGGSGGPVWRDTLTPHRGVETLLIHEAVFYPQSEQTCIDFLNIKLTEFKVGGSRYWTGSLCNTPSSNTALNITKELE